MVYAFDLLRCDGCDLRALPLLERRWRLERLLERTDVPCLRLLEAFDGVRCSMRSSGIVSRGSLSKRKASPYRSGPSRDWRKVKTAGWREGNRGRWRLFESPR